MILICLVTLMAVGVHCDHYTLDYNCAGGDIVVQNPDVGILKSATAGTDESLCNVTATADKKQFIISGCDQGNEIQFTLSTRDDDDDDDDDGIIGGSYSETYVLLCGEIDEEGAFLSAGMGAGVTNTDANSTATPGNTTIGNQGTSSALASLPGTSFTSNATTSGNTTIGNQGTSSTLASSTDENSTSFPGLIFRRKKRNTGN